MHDARFSTEIYTLGDAVPMHAPLESSMRVTDGMPLGYPRPLTVTTLNYAQTLKAGAAKAAAMVANTVVDRLAELTREGYAPMVVGHSHGAGVATLASMLMVDAQCSVLNPILHSRM
jgi:hypothetical protein